jgi:hypothetical protein
MTDRNHDRERQLDRISDEIRGVRLDEANEHAVTERVWNRITAELESGRAPLRGCDDVQALIPALVDGSLSEARALLVEDHIGDCVRCRRSLMEARGMATESPPPSRVVRHRPAAPWLKMAAAAVILIGLAAIGARMVASVIVDHNLVATVEAVDGVLQPVTSEGAPGTVEPGDTVRARIPVRTTMGSDAMLRLDDGSRIEIGPRSEVELRGSWRGPVIHLERGQIIVHAAAQDRGRLFVSTDDCRVAVKGTIFAVDHGLKGSRVSVIEGEVEVRRPSGRDLLAPGDQVTTSDRLARVTIEDQIGWSRDADQHLALVRELTQLQRDVARAIEPRTTRTATRLLDLAPSDTAVYAAVPNLAEGIDESRQIFAERLANNALLREWWQSQVVAAGVDREIETALDSLQPLGEAVGDEVVFAVPANVFEGDRGLVVMALLDDPASFEDLLTQHLMNMNDGSPDHTVVLVDDPMTVTDDAELLLWIHEDFFAATTSPARLQDLARRVAGVDDGFSDTRLYSHLAEAYDDGVSWLLGADVGQIMEAAGRRGSEHELEMLERLGLLDVSTLIVERHRVEDTNAIAAELRFDGIRRGVAGWLSEPAPMGSLEFISPQASLVTAVVAKDAAEVFDELLAAIVASEPSAAYDVAELQAQLGFDLRADLAATLGGEGAFAVDGPILPTPSWKLVAEVYDPITLQATIARIVDELNARLRSEGQADIELATETASGVTYHTLRHPDSAFEVSYAMVDGYAIAAPQRALIELALQSRASGVTLARSGPFLALLPDNGYTDCSALVYRNFGVLLESLPATTRMTETSGELVALLEHGAEPSLLCVYGETDRILATGTGGGFFGTLPALGLAGALSGVERPHQIEREPVSSRG